jgi:hypothetical protein
MLFEDKFLLYALPAMLFLSLTFQLFSDEFILCSYVILYIIIVIYEIYKHYQTLIYI